MDTKTILVTGGAGFSSSIFIRYVLSHYDDAVIVNFDKLTYAGNLANLEDVEKAFADRYVFVKGDIANPEQVRKALVTHKIQWIANFAAETHVDRSIQDASPFMQTNVFGTRVLLEESLRFGVEKFLQVSTDEVYGSLPDGTYADETFTLSPSSPYAASKAAAEMFVLAYWKTFQLPVLITRSSNNYGPFQFPEKFIPLMILNAIENKKMPIYGNGKNIRDWIYVEDNCKAIASVLWKGKIGGIYNVGGGNRCQNIEAARLILKLLGRPESLLTFVEDRKGHDFRYALDCSHIAHELGWRPSTDFEEGFRKTIAWYQNNTKWIDGVKTKEYLEYYKNQYNL